MLDMAYFLNFNLQIQFNQTVCTETNALIGLNIDLLNFLITAILPFFIMIFCSISIAYKFMKKKESINNDKTKLKKEIQLAKTMISMDIFFLVCNLPFCIQQLIIDCFELDNKLLEYGILVFDVTNSIIYIHNSCSFFVYLAFNKMFRNHFLKMIRTSKNAIAPVDFQNRRNT